MDSDTKCNREDDKAGGFPVEYKRMNSVRQKAVDIVKVLRDAGHHAYWAGGCVRDLVMMLDPQDYDVATSARPEEVMKIFPKTVPVGISFGVVIVQIENDTFEVATFRSDGRYLDGRHPEEVLFGGEKEDAIRRDFTLNGMFFDPIRDKVIDYVGGQRDIKAGIIRAIGSPLERFEEDKLRLMRAVRFSARFGYAIEPQTEAAVCEMSSKILQVSAERIRDELEKMLTGVNPAGSLRLLHKTGLLKVILPEVTAMEGVEQPKEYHPEGDVLTHTLILLEEMTRPVKGSPSMTFELAFGALFHDVGKPPTFEIRDRIRFDRHCEVGARMTEEIGHRLKFSNRQIDVITGLVRDHLKFKDVRKMRESTLKRFLRQPDFDLHLELHRLDCLASHGDLSNWDFCREKLKELPPEVIRPPRLITGNDLIKLGYSPGPVFSRVLTAVEDAQLEGQITTQEEAILLIKKQFPI